MMTKSTQVTILVLGAIIWGLSSSLAQTPDQREYLPKTYVSAEAKQASPTPIKPSSTKNKGGVVFDFNSETVGATPQSFVPVVGNWTIGLDGDNRVLVVDGRKWSSGQTAAGLADRVRSLYGERYAEFLDNVQAFAYYPYAVASGVEDFREGEIVVRFKGMEGRIDQGAGILFNLKPNGDYLSLRANPLENNLVLWKFERGKRSSVKWIRNTPTPTRQWHELKLVVSGSKVEGYINGHLYLTQTLPGPVSGRVGLWSKSDSVVYFDDFVVKGF